MKLYCIEIHREFKEVEKVYFEWQERPLDDAIIGHIKRSGHLFYQTMDKFECCEVEK